MAPWIGPGGHLAPAAGSSVSELVAEAWAGTSRKPKWAAKPGPP